MSFRLQRFDYKSSEYHRPNQPWTCGRASIGKPCLIGPGGDGQCRARAECEPKKKGDTWVCTRPDSGGGKCADGPLPDGSCCRPIPKCAPRPSVRTQRGMAVRWAIAAIVGLLLVAGGSGFGVAFFNPGPLSSQHAELEECETCHSAFSGGPIAWVSKTFDDQTEAHDVANCVSCHAQKDGLAHNQSAERLAALTEAKPTVSAGGQNGGLALAVASAFGMSVRTSETGQVACRSCHQEHQGLQAEITAMSDSQCQGCHAVVFAGFDSTHPFGDYPYTRRTRIQFDHVSHINKYFADPNNAEKAPRTCRNCHEPDDQGKLMEIGGFEQNCASCHGAFIADKPIEFIALPGIDILSLQDLEIGAGEWPEYADAEELSDFLRILLSGDEEFTEAWAFIADEGTDLLDLSEATEEELAAAETIVWSIKRLLHRTLTEGHDFLSETMTKATGTELTPRQVQQLFAAMPMELVVEAQSRWFPNLFDEMAARDEDEKVEVPDELPEEFEGSEDALEAADWAQSGGWYIEGYTINYRLKGHGDDFMRVWLDHTAKSGGSSDVMATLTEGFATPKGPGGCVGCHSIDTSGDTAAASINWHGHKATPNEVVFTEFVHEKHFSLIGDKGCATCHTFNQEAAYSASFEDWDPTTYASNFAPLDSAICADCHNETKVRSKCSDCHNYHVGIFAPAAVDKEISMN